MSHEGSSPSSSPRAALEDAHQALADLKLPLDGGHDEAGPNGPLTNGIHGKANGAERSKRPDGNGSLDRVETLEHELEVLREEKESLATQYRNLVSKLNAMRTTLGNKLKQDAVRPRAILLRDKI